MQKMQAQLMIKELAYICAIRAGHEPSVKAIAHTVLYFRCFIDRFSPYQQAKFIIVLSCGWVGIVPAPMAKLRIRIKKNRDKTERLRIYVTSM